ncbi:MAG TPA: hypothetical protein VGS97_26185 [Actinocrinis sp.]|nr:hypothetical protein [Actinocrinis sp.]
MDRRADADQDGDYAVAQRAPSPPQSGELFDSEELRQLSGYARLAELLKEAHGVLRGMDLELPDRADFVRRLLVITAASRHDQDDAMRRLERFLRAVDEKRGAVSPVDCPVPDADNPALNSDFAADQPSSVRKAG